MTKVRRHKIDATYALQRLLKYRDGLLRSLEAVKTYPKGLTLLARECLDICRYASVVEVNSPDIMDAVHLAAEALTALFAIERAGGRAVEVRLGGPDLVTLPGEVDQSVVEPTKWILAFHLALISGRDTSLIDSLCETPSSRLRQSTTSNPLYRYHWIDALQGFWSGAADTAHRIIATMEGTDPDRDDITAPNWVLNIDVPMIQLFFYALDRDERFGDALVNGLRLHKKYWTSSAQRRRDRDGFVSFGLTAMAVLGKDRGLTFDVESDYLLMNSLV